MKPIKVKVYNDVTYINSNRSSVEIDKLRPLVAKFVKDLEVDFFFNKELYEEIISLDINTDIFHKMINELDSFIEFDDVPDEVNFPYEEWLLQMLLVDDNYKNKGE